MLTALGAVRGATVAHALSESLAFATVTVIFARVLRHILTTHVGEVPLVEAIILAAHDPSSVRTIFVVVTGVGLFEQGTESDLNLRFASRAFARPGNRIEFGVKVNLEVSLCHASHRAHGRAVRILKAPGLDQLLDSRQRFRDRGDGLLLLGWLDALSRRLPLPLLDCHSLVYIGFLGGLRRCDNIQILRGGRSTLNTNSLDSRHLNEP
mmetsp:Transcript_42426/g.133640  ORF Transcript_42426/g.133640 Transcript_42426/m.133640 type:complete len:209 (-) Transcript_42426:7-633(-)